MDTKKLRQKILDLAIHGKLVPQDPNDEPASVLLERIKAEKEQLIKEGKIKRQKKSTSSDTSHYGNIPTGWANTTIGEVFNLQAGKNISSKEIHPTQSHSFQYPCYGGNGIRGYVSTPNRDGYHPIIGRQGALCGNVNLANGAFYATEHAVVVQLYCNMDLKWVFYVLTALNLNQYATATAQPGLAVNVIDDVPLLLPPIQEQERISRKIDTFFSLLESLETNIMCLNSDVQKVKSLVLDLALSGKLTSHTSHYPQLPERWENKNFAQLFEVLASKSYQIQQKEIHQSGKYPVISQSASYIEGYSDREEKLYNSETPVIIFGDHTRNVKYVNFDFIVGADGVKILKPMINSKFAYYLTLYNSKQIENRGYSRHFQYLKKLSCRIPSEKEQQRIVEIIEHYFHVFDVIITELSHS